MSNRSRPHFWMATLAGLLLATSQAGAQSNSLSNFSLFGISDVTGELVQYSFNDSQSQSIGIVRLNGDGNGLNGIKGMAHVPEHLNIYGFWNDPSDGKTKLLYINSETAVAHIVGQSLGTGHITAATLAGLDETGDLKGESGVATGGVNINPNNSSKNSFELLKADGVSKIVRSDLHQNTLVNLDGTYDTVEALSIRVKPKGNGNQNSFMMNGSPVTLKNSETYDISPAEGTTMNITIRNDHVNGNGKAMGHWWIDFDGDEVHVVEASTAGLVALQTIEASEEDAVEFEISEGKVIPAEEFAIKVSVLGAAIVSGNNDMPVTVKANIGGVSEEPFGSYQDPGNATVNDNNNVRHHIFPNKYPAGTVVTINGQSWGSTHPSFQENFYSYIEVNSHDVNSSLVKVLKNGDDVPSIEPYLNQTAIIDYVRDYVDTNTNKMVLDENQVIYLFEMGTTNVNSSAADFNDLVVLVTLAHEPVELEEDDDDDGAAGPASRLVKVNRHTGGYEQIMTLNDVYSGLSASPDGCFFATRDHQLFKLDPFTQTVTLVGNTEYNNVGGLEAAGATVCGFSTDAGQLSVIDALTGTQIGSGVNVGASDLESIVFVKKILFTATFD